MEKEAERKLAWILSREGDAGGVRLKPEYLEDLKHEIEEYRRFFDRLA